jgi:Cytotoxic translational repressor of toxin-antitoxin stability system
VGGYKVTIKNSAAKELQAVSSKQTLNKLIEKIKCLASDQHPQGSEKLAGRSAVYRLRQGDDRVIYTVDHQYRVVDVVKVGHRRDVYR